MRRLLLIVLLFAIDAGLAFAQASIVPVTHPVYDWLLLERIEGRVPTYQHEVRPMSRATIVGHLRTLAAMEERLSGGEKKQLDEFRNEFEMDRLIANRGFTREFFRGLPRSIPGAIRDRRDPVLYAGMSKDSVVSGAIYGAVGGGWLTLTEPGTSSSAYVSTQAVRVFMNTSFGLGWHLESDNIWTATQRALLAQIPRYDSPDLKVGSTASFAHDGFLSYRAPRWFEMYLGFGGQSIGAGVTDPLVLRGDGPEFGSVRMSIGGPRLNLVYVHGSLRNTSTTDTTGTVFLPLYNRVAPERFFVAHRLTWMPSSRLSVSAHEETIYANRGPDLNYLNPAVPMYLMQDRMGDRDNLMIGGDAVVRPWNGLELLGSFIIDDRSAPDPASNTFGPFKKAMLFGVEQRVVSGVRVGLSYTEVDPWAYSHWLHLNTFESEGKPLGPMMGPNSEELAARVTAWLPLRTRVMAGYRSIKRGLDPIGAAADVSKCVGGNLFCGTSASKPPQFNRESRLYKGADVHVIGRFELEAQTELIRGLPLTLNLRDDRVLRGTQLQSQRFVDFRFRYGY